VTILLSAQPVNIPDAAITKATDTIIDATGVVGALLVVSAILNIVMVWTLLRTSAKHSKEYVSAFSTNANMISTFDKVQDSVKNLASEGKTQTTSVQQLSVAVDRLGNSISLMQQSINTLMLQQTVVRSNQGSQSDIDPRTGRE
jgi:uncharacterized protein HemX